jgi:cobalt-zinc-cadmium resistance protein CzcA
VLSVTYVPMMAALVLKREIHTHRTLADRIIGKIRNWYRYTLEIALRIPYTLIAFTVLLLAGTILLFVNLGSVFIPTLEEGDLAMQMTIKPGSSLKESIRTTTKAEKLLLERFPEVEHVVSKIGTAEVPTDPMAVEDADIMIILKEKNEWVSAKDREELADLMKAALMDIKGAEFEFTQPIQLRFNELMTGVKTDVAIKLFGEDLDELSRQAYRVEDLIRDIPGSGDIRVERTEGLPQMKIRFKRDKMALYGLDIRELNEIIRAAYAGQTAGIVYEGERRFDLVVRLQDSFRDQLKLGKLFVSTPKGFLIPMTEVAEIELTIGPMQISREDARRRISIGVNVRNRDIASYIEAVKKKLQSELELPPGYYIKYGGQFENLEAARKRLSIAIPVALLLIFFLLYFAFRSIRYAAMIYIAIPTAAIGGVAALAIRGMPFSISAGVGFIALFGVAVLNGIVLLSYYNQLSKKGELNIRDLVIEGGLVRMRPVILTAAVASFGFLPMALSTTAGAEVQKPLATVVIGGLITSTFLTLVLLPLIYYLTEKRKYLAKAGAAAVVFLFVLQGNHELSAQISSMQQAVDSAMVNNLMIQNAYLEMEASAYEKQTALELGPTELNVMYGNINTAVDDRYLEIKQNFGNPLQQAKKTGELQAMTEVRNAELEQVKREIKRDTRLTWQKLAFHSAMIRLLDDQVNIFIEYLPYVESKVFEGEISRNDYNLIMVKMSRLENELTRNRIEYANAIADLRTLTMAKGDIALTDTVYTIMPLILFDTITVDPSLFDRFTAQISFSEKVISTARAGYFPLLNLGYFNQQLEQVNGFDGLIAEAHFPLWFRPKAKAVKQAKVQYELALNQYQFARLLINRQNQTWRNRLNEYVKLYNHYGEDWDEQAERLITNSRIQLESGEINYIEFMYEYASAMETIVDQMELIRNINEAILQLEYYQNR